MEEYLKDSPSDINAVLGNNNVNGNKNSTNNTLGLNYGDFGESGSFKNTDKNNGIDDIFFNGDTNTNSLNNNNNVTTNNIYTSRNELDTSNSNNEFNSNYFSTDPFLEDLESINFPGQQASSPPQFMNAPSNLDEIISPNNYNDANNGCFIDPQYFSPSGKGSGTASFQNFNPVSENGLSRSLSANPLSPSMSRHDSISGPSNMSFNRNALDLNSGSYLSPQANPQFLSPDNNAFDNNSFDTLNFSSYNPNSYLNSPPAFPLANVIQDNQQSSSIPTTNPILSPQNNPILSPQTNAANLSTSVPNSQPNNREVSTRQLSREQKLKRRREFHNAVERRRRDLIKERIKELGLLVPPSLLNPPLCAVQTLQRNSRNSREIVYLLSSIKVKETKPNKSTILNKSVDYLHHLKYVLEEQDKTRKELERKLEEVGSTTEDKTVKQEVQNQFQGGNNQRDYFNPDDFFSDVLGN